MVMSSVGRDTGQGARNRECPAEIGTVGTYESFPDTHKEILPKKYLTKFNMRIQCSQKYGQGF